MLKGFFWISKNMDIKPYKKEYDYSYTLGAFPTIELLKTHPEHVIEVIVHSTFTDTENILKYTIPHNIPVITNDKTITKLSDKENCFVVAVFKKYESKLRTAAPHVVLVSPSNMGNLGTIERSAVGFSIKDLAIIRPAVDIFNPKAIRASMGAMFRMNVKYYDSFSEYQRDFSNHEIYCFMLNAKKQLSIYEAEHSKLFSLVFGNEATGLPDEFLNIGTSVIIPQSKEVDSLNITIAAGIGMFIFNNKAL